MARYKMCWSNELKKSGGIHGLQQSQAVRIYGNGEVGLSLGRAWHGVVLQLIPGEKWKKPGIDSQPTS